MQEAIQSKETEVKGKEKKQSKYGPFSARQLTN